MCAQALGVRRGAVGYAGTKDKFAVTHQRVSLPLGRGQSERGVADKARALQARGIHLRPLHVPPSASVAASRLPIQRGDLGTMTAGARMLGQRLFAFGLLPLLLF